MNQSVTVQGSGLLAEYLATQRGVAVLSFAGAGKLEISGKNAVQFLNGLVTNDVKSLVPGTGVLAAFLDVHGKVLALARIYRRESSFLLELDGSNREKIFRNLSRFVPAGEFEVSDISDTLFLISLQGPQAESLMAALIGGPLAPGPYSNAEREIGAARVFAARHSRCGSIGFDVFVPVEDTAAVKKAILTSGESFGALEVSDDTFEIARIDAGIPREPQDISERNVLLEAGLDEAVSYTKGCYLGQEIIARIHWRGQPARQLRRLRADVGGVPPRGAELFDSDGKRVGEITSSAQIPTPTDRRIVALAYVHRYYLTQGTRFTVKFAGSIVGEAELV